MAAWMTTEQINEFQESIDEENLLFQKYNNKASSLATAKASAIAKYDIQIAANSILEDNQVEKVIKLLTNYYDFVGTAFSEDYPTMWTEFVEVYAPTIYNGSTTPTLTQYYTGLNNT